MTERLAIGTKVWTVKPDKEPTGYAPGVRARNIWGVSGNVHEVSAGHGVCYRVLHDGTFGWYEPSELLVL